MSKLWFSLTLSLCLCFLYITSSPRYRVVTCKQYVITIIKHLRVTTGVWISRIHGGEGVPQFGRNGPLIEMFYSVCWYRNDNVVWKCTPNSTVWCILCTVYCSIGILYSIYSTIFYNKWMIRKLFQMNIFNYLLLSKLKKYLIISLWKSSQITTVTTLLVNK